MRAVLSILCVLVFVAIAIGEEVPMPPSPAYSFMEGDDFIRIRNPKTGKEYSCMPDEFVKDGKIIYRYFYYKDASRCISGWKHVKRYTKKEVQKILDDKKNNVEYCNVLCAGTDGRTIMEIALDEVQHNDLCLFELAVDFIKDKGDCVNFRDEGGRRMVGCKYDDVCSGGKYEKYLNGKSLCWRELPLPPNAYIIDPSKIGDSPKKGTLAF